MKMSKTYYGYDAVKKVEEMLGRKLTIPEITVVEEEGYVDGEYLDTKGIVTSGVGQTGKYRNMSFDETFKAHEDEARKLVKDYDEMPDFLKSAIMSAAYRGDLQQSPNFRSLLNSGQYVEAAAEFLDNEDYRKSLQEGTGVAGRMERVAQAVMDYAEGKSEEQIYASAEELKGDKAWYDDMFSTVKDLFKS